MNPQLRLFLLAVVCLGMAGGIFETTFNNFLNDRFALAADARGRLEFPRELPGFLTALFAGMLFFLPETAVAGAASLAVGAGMIGLAVLGDRWAPMLGFMIVWSIGTHLMMPLQASLSMDLAKKNQMGRRLGQVGGARIAASLIGCALVLLLLKFLALDYHATFVAGGIAALVAAAIFFTMRLPGAHLQRPKFVWHRRYWLFYVLCMLFGARKQIFITFGPWVLIKIFGQPAYIFAVLWMVSALLGMFLHPTLGRIIDRYGERAVLVIDSFCVFAVCAGYGFSYLIGNQTLALWLLYACYVADHLLFGVNMARSTYLSKIAVTPQHVSPTLSLGISINHAVSMSIPALGGWIWMTYGHSNVFMFAAGIAILMLLFSAMIRVPPEGGQVPGVRCQVSGG